MSLVDTARPGPRAPEAGEPARPGRPAPRPPRRARRGGRTPLAGGVAVLWLSLIVLAPLAAIVATAGGDGFSGFWSAVTAPSSLSSFGVAMASAGVVTVVNSVAGTLIAWVLVRDEFPGKRLVNAVIDLPFALPTIVASIVLLALYGPDSPVGVHVQHTRIGVCLALAFVTLPFVIRSVQPVLMELDRDVEEAAASLGAGNAVIVRRIILPALWPAILSGAGLAFSRAIGEFGSVVLIGGGIPHRTEVTSQYIRALVEQDDQVGAAAVSVALLAASFVVLLVLRAASGRAARREAGDR